MISDITLKREQEISIIENTVTKHFPITTQQTKKMFKSGVSETPSMILLS